MPGCVRVTDTASGHGSFPPTKATEGSGDTSINNLKLHRSGDAEAPHGSPSPSPVHSRSAGAGSGDVKCNGRDVMRFGDPIQCGGYFVTASGDVFIN